jgi:hypothetical protein
MIYSAIMLRDDSKREITFLPQAHELKRLALEQSALIGKVENAEQNQTAFQAQAALAEVRKNVEKARVAAKEPVLAFGKLIDATAKAFVEDITQEEWRIGRLIGDFQQLEQAKARAAEQAKKLEEERIERERQQELRRIAEAQAEEQRKLEAERRRVAEEAASAKRKLDADKAEAERKSREAKNAKEREVAEARRKELEAREAKEKEEAERLRIEIERKNALAAATSHEAFDAANEKFGNMQAAVQSAPVAAPVRADGQKVRSDWDLVISDIWLLAKAHPTCVKIEPRTAEIKTLLNAGVKVSGVIATAITKSQVQGATQKIVEI